ncbi:MAG TPA: hypothetical protein VIX59_19765 [Candidatus Binataceae bacterium]
MSLRSLLACAGLGLATFVLASCAAIGGGDSQPLAPGMTEQQAIAKMGQPDLTDTVAQSNHGFTLLRYVWLDSGKAALFGPDQHLVRIEQLQTASNPAADASVKAATPTSPAATDTVEMEAAPSGPPQEFDPINTPLNYAFFPLKALLMYIGAGLECVTGAGCHGPNLPPPSAS